MRARLVVALCCVLVGVLCLPVVLDRVAAEHSTDTVELAVPDSVLRHWGEQVSYEELRSAGVTTVVLGMRFDNQTERPLGYDPARLDALDELHDTGQHVALALPHVLPKRNPPAWLKSELSNAVERTDATMVVSLGDPLPFADSPDSPDSSDRLAAFTDFLSRRGLVLGLSDLARPAGQQQYVEQLPGKVVRAHFLSVGPSSDIDTATVQARRAFKERGVRLVSVQPPRPEIELGVDQVTALTERIATDLPDGLRVGPAEPMGAVEPGPPLGSLAPLLVQVLALAIGVVGATLAVWICVGGSRPLGVLPGYLLAVLITVTTGLVISALAASSVFLVGGAPFRGVKLLLLAPPFAIAAAAVWLHRHRIRDLRWRPAYAVVGFVVLFVVGVYLVRSGNSGFAPGAELAARDWLDETLYSRPRFKEVLLGYPALVLALGLRTGWRWVFAVLAAVGTAGSVDTFAHFHTPLLVSLLRTGYAVGIGLLLGLVALWVVRRFQKEAP